MLPRVDSDEWSNWGLAQKLDALNEAIQSLSVVSVVEPKTTGRKKKSDGKV